MAEPGHMTSSVTKHIIEKKKSVGEIIKHVQRLLQKK